MQGHASGLLSALICRVRRASPPSRQGGVPVVVTDADGPVAGVVGAWSVAFIAHWRPIGMGAPMVVDRPMTDAALAAAASGGEPEATGASAAAEALGTGWLYPFLPPSRPRPHREPAGQAGGLIAPDIGRQRPGRADGRRASAAPSWNALPSRAASARPDRTIDCGGSRSSHDIQGCERLAGPDADRLDDARRRAEGSARRGRCRGPGSRVMSEVTKRVRVHAMTEEQGKAGKLDSKARLTADPDVVRRIVRTTLQGVLQAETTAKGDRPPGRQGLRGRLLRPGAAGQAGALRAAGSRGAALDRAVRALLASGVGFGGRPGGDVEARGVDPKARADRRTAPPWRLLGLDAELDRQAAGRGAGAACPPVPRPGVWLSHARCRLPAHP